MPPRSNLFQDVVAIVKQHVAGDASVEESAELIDTITGARREVDVVIRTTVAGYTIVVSIECRDQKRPGDVTWVEQEHAKHSRLPTNRLVLISKSGFTAEAKLLAEKCGILAVMPALAGTEGAELAASMDSLIAKVAVLRINGGAATVQATAESPKERGRLGPDLIFYNSDGQEIGTAYQVTEAIVRAADFTQALLTAHPGVAEFQVYIPDPDYRAHGSTDRQHFYMQNLGPPPHLKKITELLVTGSIEIRTGEFPLQHGNLEGADFAYGQSEIGTSPALIVMTGTGDEHRQITLRTDAINGLDLRQGNDLGLEFD